MSKEIKKDTANKNDAAKVLEQMKSPLYLKLMGKALNTPTPTPDKKTAKKKHK